jgi:hypothetical protein
MREQALLTYPTWERYTVLAHAVAQLDVRERRGVFVLARAAPAGPSPDLLYPALGMTLSEFAAWHTIGDGTRRRG